jgi:hypothetical protein
VTINAKQVRTIFGGSVLLITVLACAAGGSARPIMRDQAGGELALDGDRTKAMEQAVASMNAHCGNLGYTVTREGEVVTGQQTQQQSSQQGGTRYVGNGAYGNSSQNATTTTTAVTEYHLWYVCGGTQGAPVVVEAVPVAAEPAAAPAPEAAPAQQVVVPQQ